MPWCNDIQDLIAWTSPSGVARALYLHQREDKGCTGTVARFWLFVLLFVPSVVGTGEVILGILNRHMSTTCAYPFPLWVIIDGSAALLLVVISLVDISTVQSIKARESPFDLEEELTPAEAWKDRVRRSENLGSYACLGFIVIFVIPLFRLVWVLYGIDILYRADSHALGFLTLRTAPLAIGGCSTQIYVFMFYYLEVVALLLLLILCMSLVASVTLAVWYCTASNKARAREHTQAVGEAQQLLHPNSYAHDEKTV